MSVTRTLSPDGASMHVGPASPPRDETPEQRATRRSLGHVVVLEQRLAYLRDEWPDDHPTVDAELAPALAALDGVRRWLEASRG